MGLRRWDGELKWTDLQPGLSNACASMIEVMHLAHELREDFRVAAGGDDDQVLAAKWGTSEPAIADARLTVGAMEDLSKIFGGDDTVTIENFADKLRLFS